MAIAIDHSLSGLTSTHITQALGTLFPLQQRCLNSTEACGGPTNSWRKNRGENRGQLEASNYSVSLLRYRIARY